MTTTWRPEAALVEAAQAILAAAKENGGATFEWIPEHQNPLTPFVAEDGYQVGGGLGALPLKLAAHTWKGGPLRREIALGRIIHYLSVLPYTYVGVWHDEETGDLWVEPSDWMRYEEFATGLANVRGEKAIWNWTTMQSEEV